MGQWLSERLGQPFVIDNRPGVGGNIGTEVVVRAPPDGYTLLFVVAANAWDAALYANLNYNFIRDIALIAAIDATPCRDWPLAAAPGHLPSYPLLGARHRARASKATRLTRQRHFATAKYRIAIGS